MPEKPEVITVSKALTKNILNKTIKKVEVYWDNIISMPDVKTFKKKLINQKILNISTRGKFLLFILTDYILLIHLRMEGKFTFRTKDDELNKHEHVVFTFDDEKQMRYHDVRKFGKMYLVEKDRLYIDSPLKDLGYEFDDEKLTSDYLLEKFKKKNKFIKSVLLDQSIITGIGNIYDDEILFMSRINPYKKACELTKEECSNIIKNTNIVLKKAIEKGGTTIKSFTSEEGVHGLFQHELLVHGKKDELCPICNNKIVKDKIDGRGTYYCSNCQK